MVRAAGFAILTIRATERAPYVFHLTLLSVVSPVTLCLRPMGLVGTLGPVNRVAKPAGPGSVYMGLLAARAATCATRSTRTGSRARPQHDAPTSHPHLQARRAHPTRPEEDAFLLQLHNGFEGELSLTTEDHVSELLREAVGQIVYLESTQS